jgi:hypothetical protein
VSIDGRWTPGGRSGHRPRPDSVRAGRPRRYGAATGEWFHDAVTYRTVIGHHSRPHDFAPGRQLTVIFVPDPTAAAGRADLRFRVFGIGGSEPVSERPFYVALLALACVMCIPLLRMLVHMLREAF